MIAHVSRLLLLLAVAAVIAACGDGDGTPSPTLTPRPPTRTPVVTTTAVTPTPTATPTGTTTPTETPSPTGTASPSPSPTPTTSPTPTDTPSPSPSPSPTPTDTPTATPTDTPTETPTETASPTPTESPTATPSVPVEPAALVYSVPSAGHVIALTFDAGSDLGYTHDILDTLSANRVRATFGMTGEWAQRNPKFVQRIAREGHTFINHTWSHRSFTGASTGAEPLSARERASELAQTEAHIFTLTGVSTTPLFRPPYGDTDDSVAEDVAAAGYAYQIMWSIDTRGWAGASVEEIVERCREGAGDGGIIVMHVGSASEDGPALQAIIDALRAEGYSFTTVQGLLGLE